MTFDLSALTHPIVGAPMAGSSTPELAAATNAAGGLGFLAAGYKTAEQMHDQIARTRELTDRPFGVNLFSPQHQRSAEQADEVAAYADLLAPFAEQVGASVGEPTFNDDDFEAKVDILVDDPIELVTFTFGAIPADVIQRLQRSGSTIGFTVTSADEARRAEDLGAQILIAQGANAGGHRGTWSMTVEPNTLPATAVIDRVRAVTPLPIIGAGGVATGADIQELLDAGADAVAVGTLLVASDESASPDAYKDALTSGRYDETMLSRAFSGRFARGLANELMRAGDPEAPSAYPDVHYMTAPIRAAGGKAGDASVLALWAGAGHASAVRRPAIQIIEELLAGLG